MPNANEVNPKGSNAKDGLFHGELAHRATVPKIVKQQNPPSSNCQGETA
jgi:hypothetical protein